MDTLEKLNAYKTREPEEILREAIKKCLNEWKAKEDKTGKCLWALNALYEEDKEENERD